MDVLPLGEPLDDGHGGRDSGAGAHEHHVVVVDGLLHEAGLGGGDPEGQAGLAEPQAEQLLGPVAHLMLFGIDHPRQRVIYVRRLT